MSAEQIREFMGRVVAWPGDNDPGYVNLHWTSPNHGNPAATGREFYWGGKPFRTLDQFLNTAAWALDKPNIKDIYYCLSLQKEAGLTKNGKPKPERKAANALFLKALWLDIDIKDPPKGYASLGEALGALQAFITSVGLPPATALVASGGGLHVYWISATPLTVVEWQPYANGLKAAALAFGLRCDAGVTIDAARVLRVPGTLNHKREPARPVTLLGLAAADYDFSVALKVLADLEPISAAASPELLLPGLGKPSQAFVAAVGLVETLGSGVERFSDKLLDWVPLVKACPFFGDALATGGEKYSQPMWNLSTLMCTFLEDGHDLARLTSHSHPGYTRESTDQLWDRKQREREDRGLGWPSCSAIQSAGCTKCSVCPQLGKGKSPLHLTGPKSPLITATVTPPPVTAETQALFDHALPPGYVYDDENHLCKEIEVEVEEGPPEKQLHKIFTCRFSLAWAQKGLGPDTLNMVSTVDLGHTRPVSITLPQINTDGERFKVLAQQGVKIYPANKRHVEGYLMALMTKLHEAQAALTALPFGWYVDTTNPKPTKGARHGFVFGGILFQDDGKSRPSGITDDETRDVYRPIGDIGPWVAACRMINGRKHPEFDAIIASAFAAPLMVVTGLYSTLLNVWGESGNGKSAAMKVAIAVWGHPQKAKEAATSTSKSVLRKMGHIRNLPLFWDEIKDVSIQKHLFTTYFAGAEGIEGSRLFSDLRQQARGIWQTMMVTCSNKSFVNYVKAQQPDTDAGINRVFEVFSPKDDVGVINDTDAERMLQELELNHSIVGLEYAKVLASDPDAVDRFVLSLINAFKAEVKSEMEDRYWGACCGTILAGAYYANSFGAQIDTVALKDFLVKNFHKNKTARRESVMAITSPQYAEEKLTMFLRENGRFTVWTDTHVSGKGKPKLINIVHAPEGLAKGDRVYVQWVCDDGILKIARGPVHEFFQQRNIPADQIVDGWKNAFGAKLNPEGSIASGTQFRQGRETTIEMFIPQTSPLWPLLHTYSQQGTREQALAYQQPAPPSDGVPVETALAAAMKVAAADLALSQKLPSSDQAS